MLIPTGFHIRCLYFLLMKILWLKMDTLSFPVRLILQRGDMGCIMILVIVVICDMIKGNEWDVGDVVLEILSKAVFKFLCFIMFLALSNPS